MHNNYYSSWNIKTNKNNNNYNKKIKYHSYLKNVFFIISL